MLLPGRLSSKDKHKLKVEKITAKKKSKCSNIKSDKIDFKPKELIRGKDDEHYIMIKRTIFKKM